MLPCSRSALRRRGRGAPAARRAAAVRASRRAPARGGICSTPSASRTNMPRATQASAEASGPPGERRHQPRLGAARRDAHRFEERPVGRRQPREARPDGVAHRGGQPRLCALALARSSVTKNGLPSVTRKRLAAAAARSCGDSLSTPAAESGLRVIRVVRPDGRSPSTWESGWSRRHFVAPEAQHQHGAQERDAAAEILDEIERRVVGPVHVFEHQDAGIAGLLQRLEQRREDAILRRHLRRGAARPADRARAAISCKGPSGRGVNSASQPPICTLIFAAAAKARNSDVLPMPASPVRMTIRPWPCSAMFGCVQHRRQWLVALDQHCRLKL